MRLTTCPFARTVGRVAALLACLSFGAEVLHGAVASPGGETLTTQWTIPLAGAWRFALDPNNAGVEQQWFARELADAVRLPGTTDENHKGIFKDEQCVDRLSRVWYWKGPAWYQREVTVPDSWAGKCITLLLERSKNTRVWIDETFCGWEDTLSAPQVFDVSKAMPPGRHTITVLVDNARLPPVGPSHAVDERTQTNWNGIVGRMELHATDPVWLQDVQIYPNAAGKQAVIRARVGNITGLPATGQVTVRCASYNVAEPATFATQSVHVRASERQTVIEFTYRPGDDVPLWDEFQPALLHLELALEATADGKSYHDRWSINFGLRDFTRDRNQLKINGRDVFLRGRIDCCFYPLTGYPPMDKARWRQVLSILKDWGLNHVRFHSWCPPRAAFEAADELGVYFQAELPNKRSAFNAPENEEAAYHNIDRLDVESTETKVTLYDYGKRESELIFQHFGNHPSFVMYTLGNELGRCEAMFELVAHFQQIDPRRLYAQGSNNMHWAPSLAEGDDFWVIAKVEKDARPLRGSFAIHSFPNPHIESHPPSTMVDYSESISGVPVPLIGHETGQFQVYPDYRDIPKFTGAVRARNYEIFRERLQKAGMLDQAHDFVRASGALSAICYREDIEAALRTPDMGGFQLLDIQDFPGHGPGRHAQRVHGIQGGHWTRAVATVLLRDRAPVADEAVRMDDRRDVHRSGAGGPLRSCRSPRGEGHMDGHRQQQEGDGIRRVGPGRHRAGKRPRGRHARAAAGRSGGAAEVDDHAGDRGNPVSQRVSDLGLSFKGRHPHAEGRAGHSKLCGRRDATTPRRRRQGPLAAET